MAHSTDRDKSVGPGYDLRQLGCKSGRCFVSIRKHVSLNTQFLFWFVRMLRFVRNPPLSNKVELDSYNLLSAVTIPVLFVTKVLIVIGETCQLARLDTCQGSTVINNTAVIVSNPHLAPRSRANLGVTIYRLLTLDRRRLTLLIFPLSCGTN